MKITQSIEVLVMATLTIVTGNEIFRDEVSNINFFDSPAGIEEPSRFTLCFNYYNPLIDEIAKTYERNHRACLQNSRDGRLKAENATLAKRLALADSAKNSCELLSQCGEISTPESLFKCYANAGSENTKIMYEIKLNSTAHLFDLQEDFRLVENTEYKCTNETKRKYEKESVTAYGDFNKCKMGLIDVPKPTEAPVTPQTNTTTNTPGNTETPQTSTEAAVESTENSEITENTESTENSDAPQSPDKTEGQRRRNKFKFNIFKH